ncbi:MAG: GNAT family N-acetyltransferase [Desulfobulbaceae bacterium]|nr:MAG: GNAT family N-acetyltransferase [Desulfobulbaceae bacterium]
MSSIFPDHDHDSTARVTIAALDPESPAASRLLALSDALMHSLYPAESNHLEPAEALKKDGVIFLGGSLDGQVIACGAAKEMTDDGRYAEIKRVFVLEGWRGGRIAGRIMEELEERMAARGITVFRLETGISQPAALALYRRLGYREREPFGAYRPDPLSVFMEKRLREGE